MSRGHSQDTPNVGSRLVPVRGRGQAGMTLMEVLIAITILSVAMVGVFAGLSTTVKMSGRNKQQVTLNQVLASASESLRDLPYVRCRDAATFTSDYGAWADGFHPAGFTITVTDVSYATPGGTAFQNGCPAGNAPVRLRVSAASASDPSEAVTGEVVLRDPSASAT